MKRMKVTCSRKLTKIRMSFYPVLSSMAMGGIEACRWQRQDY